MTEPDPRSEEARKRDRQMIELLNELRVALPGVQILFAFLLTVPFTQPPFLLITDVMFDGARVWVFSGVVWLVIGGLWFLRPIARSLSGRSSGP